jgi:hypothetical protein
MVNSCHGGTGMFDRHHPPVAELADLFAPIKKYNHNHGAQGRFTGGGAGGGGSAGGSKELTAEEFAAVDKYASGTEFQAVNGLLRGRAEYAQDTPEIRATITHLDGAMDKSPLENDLMVYRGIKSRKFMGENAEHPEKMVGAIITDKGFTSTSASTQVAASFMQGGGNGVQLEIHVPRGTKAIDIRDVLHTDLAWEEHEILLHRGSEMRITKVEQHGSHLYMKADVITTTHKSLDKVLKYNHNHGPGGKFAGGGGGGGGGSGSELTPEEFQAVKSYGREDYAVLNSYLRNDPGKMPEKYSNLTKNIDSAISKQDPLPADTVVYRGLSYKGAFGNKKPNELIGSVIEDKGFMSTSMSKEVSDTFGSTTLKITVPAGAKGLDMASNLGTVSSKIEKEILLPRGTRFQITSVNQDKGGFLGIGKKTQIEAKVI